MSSRGSAAARWLSLGAWCFAAGLAIAVIVVASGVQHEVYFDAQVQLGAVRDLVQGQDPYSKYVQSPLWTYLFLLPYGFLPPDAAFPAQFWGNVVLWLAAANLALRAAGVPWGRPKTVVAAGLLILYAPVVWSMRGQVNSYNALGVGLCLALLPRRPGLAGASLVLLLAKPHLGFVLLAGLLGWMALTHRWQAVGGFAGAFAGVTAVTLALRPLWPAQWLTALANPLPEVVAGRARFAPTVGYFLGMWLPAWAGTAAGAASAASAVSVFAGWVWRRAAALSAVQVVAIAGPATLLITPYSQGYDLSLLLPSFALLVGTWFRVTGPQRVWLAAGFAVAFAFPYTLVVTGWPQATLLLPAVLCLVLTVAFRDAITPSHAAV